MTPRAYYNENDPFAAAWLRALIARNLIAPGDVDDRSICDVRPSDLRAYTQCHFFAGIGGWSYALRLAGWPDSRACWTGSCPCQPYSQAGQRKGDDDHRNLWPKLRRLISFCLPATCFGEQVAGKAGLSWLAGVRLDLEALGYAVGAADLCAAGVGAPHPRQRLYWVADANFARDHERAPSREQPLRHGLYEAAPRMEDAGCLPTRWSAGHGEAQSGGTRDHASGSGAYAAWMGDPAPAGLQREWSEYRPGGERCSGLVGLAVQTNVPQWNGATVAVQCSDGPRRISAEPDSFPLAHGVQRRMGKLRGSGNSIVPQVAAEFIGSFMEVAA
jgi:DNA (cytosine-5)-methyltransferase 1